MEVKDLRVKCLGVPLIASRLRVNDCENLKAKNLKKVNSWQATYMSYAGSVQLIISVLSSIHVYWSRIFVLPKKILKDVDAILRKFLWSGTAMRRVTAKVAWGDICLPKKEGGLGIPNIYVVNKANIVKHLWDLARKKDSLWVC